MGNRLGDNASMAMIELVDFNEVYNGDSAVSKKSTRRSRAPKKADTTIDNIVSAADTENVSSEAPAPKVKARKAEKDNDIKGSEPKKEGDA
jgi:large subunit ribosomal protein L17